MITPSQELMNVFGAERRAHQKKRSLTPAEAAYELTQMSKSGIKTKAIMDALGINSRVIRDLIEIGKLPPACTEQYLSGLWGESQVETKRKNKLSFTALGEFASFAKYFPEGEILEALQKVARFSFTKQDMFEAAQYHRRAKPKKLIEIIDKVIEERNFYKDGTEDFVQHAFIAQASGHIFSQVDLQKVKDRVEGKIGKIVDVAFQKGSFINIELIPDKIREKTLLDLMDADDFQAIVDSIWEER